MYIVSDVSNKQKCRKDNDNVRIGLFYCVHCFLSDIEDFVNDNDLKTYMVGLNLLRNILSK